MTNRLVTLIAKTLHRLVTFITSIIDAYKALSISDINDTYI